MINPAVIIIPIIVALIIAIILYFTCFTTRTIVPPAGWKPYTIRERRRISNWWRHRTKRNDSTTDHAARDLEHNINDNEESFRMLSREDSNGVPLHPIDTTATISTHHRRVDSFPSVGSNGAYDHEGIDIGAEGEISSGDERDEYEAAAATIPRSSQEATQLYNNSRNSVHSEQPNLAPTISDVRLTIDAAENALQRIQDLRTQDLPKPSPSSPTQPPILLSDEIDQINQLRTLKIWHDKMLTSVWQHDDIDSPPPLDLRYLKPFKKLVESCLMIASNAEGKLKNQLKSLEIMRTHDLSRYNDLKRTEEFAKNSLRSLIRKREQQQQQQQQSSSSSAYGIESRQSEPVDEMEAEVRQLGFRAMRERIALAKKLDIPVTSDDLQSDADDWGVDASGTIRIVGDVVGTPDGTPANGNDNNGNKVRLSGRGAEARRTIQAALAAGQVEMSI